MNDIEFLAHCRNDHKKFYYILLKLRESEKDFKRTLSGNHKKAMEYWQKKADDLINSIDEEDKPDFNFVSLMDKKNEAWIY